jgi:hypothetical protein
VVEVIRDTDFVDVEEVGCHATFKQVSTEGTYYDCGSAEKRRHVA